MKQKKLISKKQIIILLIIILFTIVFSLKNFFTKIIILKYAGRYFESFTVKKVKLSLNGKLKLQQSSITQQEKYSFSAESISINFSLMKILRKDYSLASLEIKQGTLILYNVNTHNNELLFENIELIAKNIKANEDIELKAQTVLEKISFHDDSAIKNCQLLLNSTIALNKKFIPELLQGKLLLKDSSLFNASSIPELLNGTLDFAILHNVEAKILSAIQGPPEKKLNHLQLTASEKDLLNIVFTEFYYNYAENSQAFAAKLSAGTIDSEPLLALINETADQWLAGRLKDLELELAFEGNTKEEILQSLELQSTFATEYLKLKESLLINSFSRSTDLNLPDYLAFDRGKAAIQIKNKEVNLETIEAFQGKYPNIKADGNFSFDGDLNLKLDLGFAREISEILAQKRYFKPFAIVLKKENAYYQLPAALHVSGTMKKPKVDFTALLKASAKQGATNIKEIADRIHIRIPRRRSKNK